MRRDRPHLRLRALRRALALAALAAAPAAAQTAAGPQTPAETKPATLAGRVVDAFTGEGVAGVAVRLTKLGKAVATGEDGYFLFPEIPEGEHEWTFTRLGYATLNQEAEVRDGDRFTVALLPRPEVLEGLTVTVSALEANRRSVSTTVRAVGEAEILASGFTNPLDVLTSATQVDVVSCPPKWCVRTRGELIYPIVWIDDQPARGGLTELMGYPAADLYTIEAFAGGRLIRAYTRIYMEGLARSGRRPRRVTPNWGGGAENVQIEAPPPGRRKASDLPPPGTGTPPDGE